MRRTTPSAAFKDTLVSWESREGVSEDSVRNIFAGRDHSTVRRKMDRRILSLCHVPGERAAVLLCAEVDKYTLCDTVSLKHSGGFRPPKGFLSTVCVSADSQWMVSCWLGLPSSEKSQIRIWDPAKDEEWLAFETEFDATLIAISLDKTRIVVGSTERLEVWRQATRDELGTTGLGPHPDVGPLRWNWRKSRDQHGLADRLSVLQLSANGIVAGFESGRLAMLGSVMTPDPVMDDCHGVHADCVRSICVSDDGRWLLTGSDDKSIGLWAACAVASGCWTLRRQLSGHSDQVRSVNFSPDRRWIVSASADETVRLWVAATGALADVLQHTNMVNFISIAPTRPQCSSMHVFSATAHPENVVRIWAPAALKDAQPSRVTEESDGDAGAASSSTEQSLTKRPRVAQEPRGLLIFVCSPQVGPLPEAANEAVGIVGLVQDSSSWDVRIYTEVSGGLRRMGGTPLALSHYLSTHHVTYFHFIGHTDAMLSGQSTLGFTGPDGGLILCSPQDIVELIKPYAEPGPRQVQLIFINGCDSEPLGELLRKAGVPVVVCWRTKVLDYAGSIFASNFWQAFARGESPRGAFEYAAQKLKLITRDGHTEAGLATKVQKLELRDPAMPAIEIGWTPLPVAAGIPVYLCEEGALLPRPSPL